MKKEKKERWIWARFDDESILTLVDMQDCLLFSTDDIELIRPATDEEVAEHFTKEQGGTVKVDAEGVKYYSF